MFGGIEEKCRQLQAALGNLQETDLSKLRVHIHEDETGREISFSASDGITEPELQNAVTLLVANIGSLKDHLKKWCDINNRPFFGENLIASDRNVALVHDLWNSDKHGGLDRPPRSGCVPRIVDLRKVLRLTSGSVPNSGVYMTIDPQTGQMEIGGSGGAGAQHVIVASVISATGEHLGDLEEICRGAFDGWERLIHQAGINI